jgi:hypothetical protein
MPAQGKRLASPSGSGGDARSRAQGPGGAPRRESQGSPANDCNGPRASCEAIGRRATSAAYGPDALKRCSASETSFGDRHLAPSTSQPIPIASPASTRRPARLNRAPLRLIRGATAAERTNGPGSTRVWRVSVEMCQHRQRIRACAYQPARGDVPARGARSRPGGSVLGGSGPLGACSASSSSSNWPCSRSGRSISPASTTRSRWLS